MYKQNNNYHLRQIGNDYFLVAAGQNANHFQGLIVLNDVSVFVWNLLETEKSLFNIVDALIAEYDIDKKQAENDIKELIEVFINQGAIVHCN